MSMLKHRTGLTPSILGRFAICISLQDPSPPNPDEYDEKGSEINLSSMFGEHEPLFMALMIKRLRHDGLDINTYLEPMVRAHFNRGTTALFPRIRRLADIYTVVSQAHKL